MKTVLSGLFFTDACYKIKENYKEKSFYCRKLRKAYFALVFFLPVQIADTN